MSTQSDPAAYRPSMVAEDYLDLLREQGRGLANTARSGAAQDHIPFCPGWALRDLVPHAATVFNWVTDVVREAREVPSRLTFEVPASHDGALDDLTRAVDDLVDALRHAPQDLDCWTIWAEPPARVFWLRRMLHEAVIHHVDARNAGRSEVVPGVDLDPALAVDGIDEMICGFARRYAKRLRDEQPATLSFVCAQTGLRWWARISADAPSFGRGAAPTAVDAEVTGHPGELLLLLWNRRLPAGLDVRGDARGLDIWARHAHL